MITDKNMCIYLQEMMRQSDFNKKYSLCIENLSDINP